MITRANYCERATIEGAICEKLLYTFAFCHVARGIALQCKVECSIVLKSKQTASTETAIRLQSSGAGNMQLVMWCNGVRTMEAT